MRRCDLKDHDGALSPSEEPGVISGKLKPLYSVWDGLGWQNSEGPISSIRQVSTLKLELMFCYTLLPPPPRIVPDQDDHVACQKFCAETAHCVGYTFVKVAFDVVACVVVVLVVVAVVGGVVVVIIVVVDIPTPLSRV